MAGHSHSSNVKFRKDRVNAVKAKTFAKLTRMITVAARLGGGDADSNPRLRLALEKARLESMPKDNIERAIRKGTGEGDVGSYEEIVYEGYAPGGVAVLIEALSDNRNRTAAEVRNVFERFGGNLGGSGTVAWMFERKANFVIAAECASDEEELLEIALEAGAEDLVEAVDHFEVRGDPGDFACVRGALERRGVPVSAAEVGYFCKTPTSVSDIEIARKIVALLDALDDHDDVQTVFANHAFTDQVLVALSAPK